MRRDYRDEPSGRWEKQANGTWVLPESSRPGHTGAGGMLLAASGGGGASSTFANYLFDASSVMADPSDGHFRASSAPSTVTQFAFSHVTVDGTDISVVWDSLVLGDTLTVASDADIPDVWIRYEVVGASTNNGSWQLIPVAYMGGSAGAVWPADETRMRVRVVLASGVNDHGMLKGLTDDDHMQYHTDGRADARYLKLTGGTLTGNLNVSNPAGGLEGGEINLIGTQGSNYGLDIANTSFRVLGPQGEHTAWGSDGRFTHHRASTFYGIMSTEGGISSSGEIACLRRTGAQWNEQALKIENVTFPGIAFHQPGIFAGVLRCNSGGMEWVDGAGNYSGVFRTRGFSINGGSVIEVNGDGNFVLYTEPYNGTRRSIYVNTLYYAVAPGPGLRSDDPIQRLAVPDPPDDNDPVNRVVDAPTMSTDVTEVLRVLQLAIEALPGGSEALAAAVDTVIAERGA